MTEEDPGSAEAGPHGAAGSLLRRIRRIADLSQRELAGRLGVARSTVARAETGERDLPVTLLVRAATLAGLRLTLVARTGREVTGMDPGAVRDRAGRLFPAHLDVRYGDQGWWHGEERYSRDQPWYTFDRKREERDERRERRGAPADHQAPRPGDSPRARAGARREAARAAQAALRRELLDERRRLGVPDPFELVCSCPVGCDALLLADEPLPPAGRPRSAPHVPGCACRCDVC